jgi:hypothetical protein
MLANYEKFGFKIKAEHLPESCTWCPFWTAPMADVEFAGCYITGSEVRLDTGEADKRRMPDCPIKCKRGRSVGKKFTEKNKRINRQEE